MNEPLNRDEALLNSVIGQHLVTIAKEKRLVEYAAENPFYVLNRIFEFGDLQNLKEYTLQWFHVALCVDLLVYEDGESRSALLHFFNEVQRLIDALYILKVHNEQNDNKSTDGTLPDELKISSLYFEERINPILAVVKFFSTFSIEHSRRELWDWKHAGISYGPPYPDDMNEVQVLLTYEDVECLLETGYALYLKEIKTGGFVNPQITTLKDTIDCIVETCNPDNIFELHTEYNGRELTSCQFLILLPKRPKHAFNEYEKAIQHKCPAIKISLIFNKTEEAYKFLQHGYTFYTVIYNPNKLVYSSDKTPLPSFPQVDKEDIVKRCTYKFDKIFTIAENFLHGARYYVSIEQLSTAAFMLHQAAEHSCRALLYSLMAQINYEHDLGRLVYRCSFCAPELKMVFPCDSEKETQLFQSLNNAYSDSRYKSSYQISLENVVHLLERIERLQIEVHQFFNESIIAFKAFLPGNQDISK